MQRYNCEPIEVNKKCKINIKYIYYNYLHGNYFTNIVFFTYIYVTLVMIFKIYTY